MIIKEKNFETGYVSLFKNRTAKELPRSSKQIDAVSIVCGEGDETVTQSLNTYQ
jgi:hypothetical protein